MNFYKIVLITILFLFCVGNVCATEPADNGISGLNVSDVNCSDDNLYCCGAIAFQSVLKENDINITLEEVNKVIHSVNGTTSMQGLIDGAKAYNLTAYPVKINASDLQPNFIVHMNIMVQVIGMSSKRLMSLLFLW